MIKLQVIYGEGIATKLKARLGVEAKFCSGEYPVRVKERQKMSANPGIKLSVFKLHEKECLQEKMRFFNWVKRETHGFNQSIDAGPAPVSEALLRVKTIEVTILS